MDGRRILVVDDHKPLREALQAILGGAGYDVETACDGVQALERMEDQRPDLIVADIMMPEMSGYEFCQRVRARQEWVSIPFIFLTVKRDRADVLRAKALGVNDYLTKPLDPWELLVAVGAQLERAEALEEAAEAEVEKVKDEIVRVLGHELRTPLTYIRCYADLARKSASSLEDSDLEKYWGGVSHGAERLTGLAEDAVLLAQLGTERARERFWAKATLCAHLDEVVKNIADAYAARAAERGMRLAVTTEPDLPRVRVYGPYLSNALGRLIDNAIKFSQDGAEEVSVSARRAGEWVEISVTDEGVGIAAKEISNLFHRFRQIDRQEMEQQGLGLGLTIAGRLIDLHHGEIRVESTPGEGSTFTIRLPVADAESV